MLQFLQSKRVPVGIIVIILALFMGLAAITTNQLIAYRKAMLDEKRQKTRELVENVSSLILFYYLKISKEDLPEQDAKNYATQAIRQLHYDDSAYFWIMDMNYHIVMHPSQPDLEGKDLKEFRDPLGKAIFQEMTDIVKYSGAGYISYYWTKPDIDKTILYPKLSYVKGFEPWGWIIGSGIYVDDVDRAFWNAVYVTASLSVAFLVFSIALALTISESLKRK